jgi:hypothetical protein
MLPKNELFRLPRARLFIISLSYRFPAVVTYFPANLYQTSCGQVRAINNHIQCKIKIWHRGNQPVSPFQFS